MKLNQVWTQGYINLEFGVWILGEKQDCGKRRIIHGFHFSDSYTLINKLFLVFFKKINHEYNLLIFFPNYFFFMKS